MSCGRTAAKGFAVRHREVHFPGLFTLTASRGCSSSSSFLEDAGDLPLVVDRLGRGKRGPSFVQQAEPPCLVDEGAGAGLRARGAVDHADHDPLIVDGESLGPDIALGLLELLLARLARPDDRMGQTRRR